MKTLQKTFADLPHLSSAVLFILLAGGLLSGCQHEPTTIEFIGETTRFTGPTIVFPPPTIDSKPEPEPEADSEQRPQLTDIATRQFSIAGDRNIVGGLAVIQARDGDTLPDIARHFGLGYNEINIANPAIRPWTPKAGADVLLPLQFILPNTPRKGIVLNLANMRLFYYPPKQPDTVFTYALGIGREGWNTPLGQTSIITKKIDPAWTVPESIRREHAAKGDPLPSIVPPGPENPLGKHALLLGFKSYLIHGTNKPYGVGMQVSHGCVRLYPEDIAMLFKKISAGTPVRIIHQPYMTAWDGDMLYLEAHKPLPKWAGQEKQRRQSLLKHLQQQAAEKDIEIDWEKVDQILQRSDGIPTPILAGSPDLPQLVANAPEVPHPGDFYGQPIPPELTGNDWALWVADFKHEHTARQLAEILNHQGPPIPARPVEKDGSYQVIAGPFKNRKEAKLAARRIQMDFDADIKFLPPEMAADDNPDALTE